MDALITAIVKKVGLTSVIYSPAYSGQHIYTAKKELRQQLPFQEANQVICRATARHLPSGFGRNSAGRCGTID